MATDAYDDILKQAREVLSAEEQHRLAAELAAGRPRANAASQREALRELMADLDALPVGNPADGASNRDHDRLLYGG